MKRAFSQRGAKLALTSIASGVLVACSGGGGSSAGGDLDTFVPPPPIEPTAATLEVLVADASDPTANFSGQTVKVLDDPAGVLDSSSDTFTIGADGKVTIPLKEDLVLDEDGDGLIETPVNLELAFDFADYLQTVSNVVVTDAGVNAPVVTLVARNNPPAGVVVQQEVGDLTAGDVSVTASAAGDPNATAATLELPKEVVLTSDTGEVLDSSSLSIVVAAFDASEPTAVENFPGGTFAVDIQNPEDFSDATGDGDGTDGGLELDPSAFVSVQLTDANGNRAKNVEGAKANISLTINPNTTDENGDLVVAGDEVPIFSYDEDSGTWVFEELATLQERPDGTLYVDFETGHFSWWSWSYYYYRRFFNYCYYPRVAFGVEDAATGQLKALRENVDFRFDYYNQRYRPAASDALQTGIRRYRNNRSFTNRLTLNSPKDLKIVAYNGSTAGITNNGRSLAFNICNGGFIEFEQKPTVVVPNLNISSAGALEDSAAGAVFRYRLDKPTTVPVTFNYTTADASGGGVGGLADSDIDYQAVNGTETIPAGSTSGTITVPFIDDSLKEPTERFILEISDVSGAAIRNRSANVTGYIANDDRPQGTVSDVVVNETAGTADVTVTLDSAAWGAAINATIDTVNTTAELKSDFGDLIFPDGKRIANRDVRQWTVTVPIIDDDDVEGPELVRLNLSSPWIQFSSDTVDITINSDDVPNNAVDPVVDIVAVSGALESREGSNTGFPVKVPFKVELSSARSDKSITVDFATQDGTALAGQDYVAIPSQTVTFAPNETSKVFELELVPDNVGEPVESLELTLANPVGAQLAAASRSFSIQDDDIAVITASSKASQERDPGDAAASHRFVVKLSRKVSQPVTVNWSVDSGAGVSADDSDFTATGGTITFAANEVTKFIDIPLVFDDATENTETFKLSFSAGSNFPSSFVSTDLPQGVQGVIKDDDFIIVSADAPRVREGQPLVFEVTARGASSLSTPVVVQYETRAGTASGNDYTSASGTIQFSGTDLTETISIATTNDSRDESDETVRLILTTDSTLVSSITEVNTGTILDDDEGQATGGTGGTGATGAGGTGN